MSSAAIIRELDANVMAVLENEGLRDTRIRLVAIKPLVIEAKVQPRRKDPKPAPAKHVGYALGSSHRMPGLSSVALCGTICRSPKPMRKVPTCEWCELMARITSMPRSERGQITAEIRRSPERFW